MRLVFPTALCLPLISIPESPRWLIERKREDRARRILEKVGGAEFDSIKAGLSQAKGNWGELFSARLQLQLLIGVLLALLSENSNHAQR